jgi:hypothetical protein
VPSNGYGFVYPVLIAPAWALFTAPPDAYAAAKVINALLMSLAAVPAYFLSRRLLAPPLALVVAGLTVLVPSMLYTGMVMTENAFYPLFLLAALVLVLTLERPTPLRQVLLLAVCGLAFATRAQALALLPAACTAPLLLALIERRGLRRGLRPFATLYGLLGGAAIAALLVTVARGRSPLTLLGAYEAATDSDYTVQGVLRFFLYHVAELDLYLGIVPFAALVTLWLAPRTESSGARAFAAASLALVFWLVAEVAMFASQPFVDRIQERNMFYVAPLALTALVALAGGDVISRRRGPVLVAAGAAAALPLFVPYERFITTSAVSDTFALLPLWWVQDHYVTLEQVWLVVGAASLAAAALFVLLPRRFALVLPALVALYFAGTAFVVENGRHGIRLTSVGSLWAGIRVAEPNWLDRAVGPDAKVDFLWTGKTSVYAIWENEFFNRSLHTVYGLTGPSPGGLPETPAVRRPDGTLVSGGKPVRAEYVVADGSVDLAGRAVGQDPRIGIRLYRVGGPVIVLADVKGLYRGDTWSGPSVSYERVQCSGGRLTVLLQSDDKLFRAVQTVTARDAHTGRVLGSARVAPTAQRRLSVPLHPGVNGRCRVTFEVGRTAIPARVVPDSRDGRVLGAHFLSFDYRP